MTLDVHANLANWSHVQVLAKLPCACYFTHNAGTIRSQGLALQSHLKLRRQASVGIDAAVNHAYARDAVLPGIAAQDIRFGSKLTNGNKVGAVVTKGIAIQPGDLVCLARPRTLGARLKSRF